MRSRVRAAAAAAAGAQHSQGCAAAACGLICVLPAFQGLVVCTCACVRACSTAGDRFVKYFVFFVVEGAQGAGVE